MIRLLIWLLIFAVVCWVLFALVLPLIPLPGVLKTIVVVIVCLVLVVYMLRQFNVEVP